MATEYTIQVAGDNPFYLLNGSAHNTQGPECRRYQCTPLSMIVFIASLHKLLQADSGLI